MLASSRVISLAEQVILSTTNFCSIVIFARFLSIEEFGVYCLAFTLLTLLQGFQRMVISISMVVLSPDIQILHLHRHNWNFVQAGIVLIPLIIVAMAFILFKNPPWLLDTLLALMILLAPMFYYEFYRRWLLQERETILLLPMIGIYTLLFSLAMLFIALHGGTAIMAATGMAAGATGAAIIGYFATHQQRHEPSPPFRPFLSELWKFGRWQVMSYIAYTGYNSLIQVIVSFFSGPAGVALMSVTRNLVQPITTFIMAIDNVDKPRASAALANEGIAAMLASLRSTSITLILPGILYLALIGVFAEPVLHHLFDGKYDNGVFELRLWVPVFLILLITQPLDSALYILKRPDIILHARLVAALIGIFLALVLIPLFNVTGALVAMTLSWLVSLILTWRGRQNAVRDYPC